jgi:hypothetical protein
VHCEFTTILNYDLQQVQLELCIGGIYSMSIHLCTLPKLGIIITHCDAPHEEQQNVVCIVLLCLFYCTSDIDCFM